ncbi:phage holin family protein [Rubrolithibacter danxiaensis]|uniref:phage holin family protein n=1 Tax=Rubrolithibacter danxiaensis TaxID=3390805 RepID=UPI003BF8E696
MSETPDKNQDIIALIKEYIATRIELGRLSIMERVVMITANLITDTFVLIMSVLAFLFGSFTLGFFLSDLLDSYTKGFGILTLIYLLLALLMVFTKDKLVEKYLHNFMVKRIFQNKK